MNSSWPELQTQIKPTGHVTDLLARGHPATQRLTSVGVGLGAVAILQSVSPRALVPCIRRGRLPHAVTTFEALRPLSPVQPPAARLHTQTVTFTILPLALERAPAETNMANTEPVTLFIFIKISYNSVCLQSTSADVSLWLWFQTVVCKHFRRIQLLTAARMMRTVFWDAESSSWWWRQ
jgi:hypothetical protein